VTPHPDNFEILNKAYYVTVGQYLWDNYADQTNYSMDEFDLPTLLAALF